ncbi:DUF2271 domain-containing protein [Flagellimonas marinaquae]|jgi:hypothetical protein|uniref:DUF2271 domain-containing protein n=1 Tax=Flagellimonas marinaquae TaxID=254955 RepID=A0AA48HHI5_9FLAO|nr:MULTISPECIES: DUF2271 domain-containing protein [Allomuricauda]USD24496.1 DUF2271 domain-containing protein [Allomuricauda aquimarina]BDW93533.1 hypothetical protein MACH07_23650 [Allomuricauda aquimarina]
MKKLIKLVPVLVLAGLLFTAFAPTQTKTVKCLIQMTNYTGEGAYLVVSLLKPDGEYEQTLYVQGKDSEWYSEIPEWWKFYGKYRPNIDGISGETISGGERTVTVLQIPEDKIDKGYRIRFETSVEDQEYYMDDIQFELTSDNLKSKKEGKGFIRYVRMLAQ